MTTVGPGSTAWVNTQPGPRAVRRAAVAAGFILAAIYAATTAPDVTWWDAGEFIAAAHTLGIPHPPGTPLYILLANVWASLLGFVSTAFAVNLLSAVCAALAGAAAAALIARATRSAALGLGAALCAGTMSTVWASATEAEVYAPALLLAMLMLVAGERAGRTGDPRWVALTAYLFALAAPLHVIALVAAPAAIVLAAIRPDEGTRRATAAVLTTAFVVSGAIGTGRWVLGAAALLVLMALAATLRRGGAVPVAIVTALSAFAFMNVRATHDPGINQGNPATFAALLDVISREQYTIAGLLPRQAPTWLQIVNFLEYADWQVALGLGPTVTPTVGRMLVTIAYIVLGAVGFRLHLRADPRSWRALAVLGVCGSLGVIAYLNLKAGPSIGYGILPDDAPHEPRERDYFFAFAFWTWGVWAGVGAMAVATRWLRTRPQLVVGAGLVLAAAPALLNWTTMNRRRAPEASLPRRFAEELLHAAPPRAVLLVAGDNDTYPLWYLQRVHGVREDVIVITYPLIGADWYREELQRRSAIGRPPPHATWLGMRNELGAIVRSAREQGRPIAASVTVERSVRELAAPRWRLAGLVYIVVADSNIALDSRGAAGEPTIDIAAAERAATRLATVVASAPRRGIDPTSRLMHDALTCPRIAMRATADTSAARLLESTCNSR